MEPKRQEIIDYLLKTKLPETCVKYTLNKCKNKYYKEEILQELWLWLLTYDLDKLTDAYEGNHLSALITRYLTLQYFSGTSPFYKNYKKFDLATDEITEKEKQIPDE